MSKIKARNVAEKRLARIVSDLDKAAAFFEERGLDTQRALLDAAADSVEDVQDSLSSIWAA